MKPRREISIMVKIPSESNASRVVLNYRTGQGFHLADIGREGVNPKAVLPLITSFASGWTFRTRACA